MYKIVGIMVCSLILFSCSNEEERIKKVTCVSSMSEISDTLFFGKIKNLISNGKDIYFIDEYRECIVHTNVNDWKLRKLIGVAGEGPDELCNLLQFTLKNDTLYALDGGCAKLVAYNLQGDICAKYPLPLESKLKIGYHFLVNGGNKMDISTRFNAGAFVNMDLSNGNMSFWDERFRFEYASQNIMRNGRHLFETTNGYITVSDNMPQLVKYDMQKKRIEVYDYSDIPTVKKRLLQIEKEVTNTNSYGIICEDACVSEDKLYLLLISNNDGFTKNRIAVFSLFPQIKWDGMLEMSGRIYSTFCVSHDQLIAYESKSNCFDIFSLSNLWDE